jgi:hypothetical protein
VTGHDKYKISQLANYAELGWFWHEIAPGVRALVHPDRPCTAKGCPQEGTEHRHSPDIHQRERQQDMITRALRIRADDWHDEVGRKADVAELSRLFDLNADL